MKRENLVSNELIWVRLPPQAEYKADGFSVKPSVVTLLVEGLTPHPSASLGCLRSYNGCRLENVALKQYFASA